MDTSVIRRQNLNLLLAEFKSSKKGTQKQWAARAGLAPDHVTQMKNGHRDMGGDVARRIERSLKLDFGWMDLQHSNVDGVSVELPEHDLRIRTYEQFAGRERTAHTDNDKNMETVPRSWIEEHQYDEENLFSASLGVTNLRPAYLETDTVIVNTEFDGKFKDGAVYAFGEIGEKLAYFLVFQRTSGGILLANGSESDRPDEVIDAESMKDLKVVGQVVRMTRTMAA